VTHIEIEPGGFVCEPAFLSAIKAGPTKDLPYACTGLSSPQWTGLVSLSGTTFALYGSDRKRPFPCRLITGDSEGDSATPAGLWDFPHAIACVPFVGLENCGMKTMTRYLILLLGCLALMAEIGSAQEVVVTDFPFSVGGSVDPGIFQPYQAQLKTIADTLRKYPAALAVVTGGADGGKFLHNHDAKNPGLAVGRAHALRNWLIANFNVDSTQLVIQSKDSREIGPRFRFASVRIVRLASELAPPTAIMQPATPTLQQTNRTVGGVSFAEHLGLQIGAGVSSSPFGGIPMLAGAVTWKRQIYVEAIVGHTFWNGSFRFQNVGLNTRRRMAGSNLIVYPFKNLRAGCLAGWVRIEEISQDYYQYVRKSEGLLLGMRAEPFSFLSVTGAYYPSTERTAGIPRAETKNNLFLISVTAHKTFGGAN
jgi:hypothetical protein